ncbi:tRNA pseudouridine13 synthase [Trypanosoma theileri]|uniref:tRNA pseudouridine13 synthase n=1 Tax=Trypanosoma theileri TaxID=67003 RepID=A0A1X0NUT8_9TRYP|nr:tRNA pseudouridine13 synthase [Trypanosoma theileri]ORC88467.1 tRNA pseudouridine13 synthase [Trypanosoma theileri]
MKLASKGPIIRWSLRNPATGVTVSQNEWRSGRNLNDEEKSSGLLLRLCDTCGSSSREILPVAVVKAQSSDFQVNEIDENGNVAIMEKAPKGKWRKISRQKTLLVEDNANTPFSDPAKTFSPRVLSHGEYARVLGKLPRDLPVLRFVLYRDSYSLRSVENRLGYTLSLDEGCTVLHDNPGGSFGCITQYGACIGMTKELLPHASRHYNLHSLIFDPKEYQANESLGRFLRGPRGHFYRLLLRCVEGETDVIKDRLKIMNERGFINYFGIETFGVGANRSFEIASFAAKEDFRHALGCLLQSVAEYDGAHYGYFLQYLNADPNTVAGISKLWADAAKHMRSQKWLVNLLAGLAKYHKVMGNDEQLRDLWEAVPLKERIYSSAAEFVWNAMVSQRLLSNGLKVVEGDVVRYHAFKDLSTICESQYNYKLVTAEEAQRGMYQITDVVLPVPYDVNSLNLALFPQLSPLDRQLYQEFAAKHGVSFLFEKSYSSSSFQDKLYRPLIVKPVGLQVAVIDDPNSFTCLKSDLSVMQERKPIQVGDMDYPSRVREPCVYNVSERFVEKMEAIKKVHGGKSSVAICCRLPNGSSPFVMLREIFSLRYASFQDLYGVL